MVGAITCFLAGFLWRALVLLYRWLLEMDLEPEQAQQPPQRRAAQPETQQTRAIAPPREDFRLLDDASYFRRLGDAHPKADKMCRELIAYFADLSGKWIATERTGPTGIGATAEKAAGIAENNSRKPDYNGVVELKTSRMSHGRDGFITLFTLSPDFSASAFPSTRNLLDAYGYRDETSGARRLNLAMDATGANNRGHWIEVDATHGWLRAMHTTKPNTLCWSLDDLTLAAVKKLRYTVFVFALQQAGGTNRLESFRYERAVHARLIGARTFLELLHEGVIKLEFNIRDGKSGEKQDHKNRGFAFRIRRRDLPRLFQIVEVYDLSSGRMRKTDGSDLF